MKPIVLAALAASAIAFTGSTAFASPTANFTPLAGQEAILDHTDGTYTNARFFNPTGIAVDSQGTVYVADSGDHTVRKVTAGGVSTVLAGLSGTAGNVDGSGTGARLDYPYAVAVDSQFNVYVTDILDNSVRKITSGGAVTTIATGFSGPEGVAVDGAFNVYVSDTNNSVIKKIAATGGGVTILAGTSGATGTTDGVGLAARFNYPAGLATDAAGNVYVADYDNSAIRMISAGGQVTTIAGTSGTPGHANAVGTAASFDHPTAVSVDPAGNIYVVDTSNQLVREIAAGTYNVTTVAGTWATIGAANGPAATATFFYPQGIAATGSTVYVADTGNHSIRQISAGSVSVYAGSVGLAGLANGNALSSATFRYPYGVAVDAAGNVYVADAGNNVIREISNGNVSTLAGTGIAGFANGANAAATFNSPSGVAIDGSGNLYVADTGNNVIRKIVGGVVTTYASGFSSPQGVAVDAAGNVYVADTNNDVIVKLTAPAGGVGAPTVSTLAGAYGQVGSSDSTVGTSARFNRPNALAVDSAGNVYVSDFANYTVRKIAVTTTNTTTLAGAPGQPGLADGSVSSARFNQTYGVAVDSAGNVYVTDTLNRVVRQITPTGVVSTVTGTMARFFYPEGIAIDSGGHFYVSDSDNNSISVGTLVSTAPTGLANHTVAPGGTTTFQVITPDTTASYAWQYSSNGGVNWNPITNGGIFSGANTTALTITGATAGMSGYQFRAIATNSLGVTNSPAGTLYVGTARLLNLSSSGFVGVGANDLSAGFIISGTGTKAILLRGIGPTLANFGVPGVLANPALTLFTAPPSTVQASNTVWGGTALLTNVMSAVYAFALPSTSADSALYISNMITGTHTATVDGVGGTTGAALIEVYDADTGTPTTRLSNISTRASVGTANLVAGFVIGGTTSETVLIRGVGPALATFGVPNALSNVQLTLYDKSSTVIGSNHGWGGTAFLSATFTQISAFPLPGNSLDSAMVVTLPPGSYTASVSGVGGATGNAMIEIYEVP